MHFLLTRVYLDVVLVFVRLAYVNRINVELVAAEMVSLLP